MVAVFATRQNRFDTGGGQTKRFVPTRNPRPTDGVTCRGPANERNPVIFPMKSLTKITLLAAGLAVAAIPFVNAAKVDAKAAARADKKELAGKRPLLRAAADRQALKQRIAKRLDLSADQVAQLKTKRADVAASIKSIRSDTSLTPEQRRAKVREAIQSASAMPAAP